MYNKTVWFFHAAPNACGRCQGRPKTSFHDPGKTHKGCNCKITAEPAYCEQKSANVTRFPIGSHRELLMILTPGGERRTKYVVSRTTSGKVQAGGSIGGITVGGSVSGSSSETYSEEQLFKHTGQTQGSEKYFGIYADTLVQTIEKWECANLSGALMGVAPEPVINTTSYTESTLVDIVIVT